MAPWLDQYLSSLEERDKTEKVEQDLYNKCSSLLFLPQLPAPSFLEGRKPTCLTNKVQTLDLPTEPRLYNRFRQSSKANPLKPLQNPRPASSHQVPDDS